jgi:hypothetical protein
MDTKTCNYCKMEKDTAEFYTFSRVKNNKQITYLSENCVECTKIKRKLKTDNDPSINQRKADKARLKNLTPEGKCDTLTHSLRKSGIEYSFSKEDFLSLKDYKCEYCNGDRDKYSVVPRDLNVGYTAENLQPVCSSCKRAKVYSESEEAFQRKMIRRYGITPEKKTYLESLIGTEINNFKVIKIAEKIRGHFKILCECKCGTQKILREKDLVDGITKSCGCLKKGLSFNGLLTHKPKTKVSNCKTGFNRIKNAARSRHLMFDIPYEDYLLNYYNKNCYYCNAIDCTSLDRIDSSKGYLHDNIVSCCKICNSMKNTLSQNDFISHIRQIINHYKDQEVGGVS